MSLCVKSIVMVAAIFWLNASFVACDFPAVDGTTTQRCKELFGNDPKWKGHNIEGAIYPDRDGSVLMNKNILISLCSSFSLSLTINNLLLLRRKSCRKVCTAVGQPDGIFSGNFQKQVIQEYTRDNESKCGAPGHYCLVGQCVPIKKRLSLITEDGQRLGAWCKLIDPKTFLLHCEDKPTNKPNHSTGRPLHSTRKPKRRTTTMEPENESDDDEQDPSF